VYDRRDITIETGKEVVKRSVVENSEARKNLKSAMAKSKAGKRHEVLKQVFGYFDSLPRHFTSSCARRHTHIHM
jgi:hypothetical protein